MKEISLMTIEERTLHNLTIIENEIKGLIGCIVN